MLNALKQFLFTRELAGGAFKSHRLFGILYLLAANLFRAGLGVVTSAIVFRSLGPQDVGRMTTALAVIGVLSIIGEFGFRDGAINYIARSLETAPEKAASIARTFLVSKTFLSTLASGVALSAAGLVAARFFPGADVAGLIRLAAFSLLADGLLGYSLVILEARQDFRAIGVLNGAQSLLRFALILALFVLGKVNLVSLLLLETVVPLAAFLYSLGSLPRVFRTLRRPFLEYLGPLFHFSKWIGVAALSSLLVSRLDVVFLSHFQAPAVVGLYAAALALVNKIDLIKVPILTTAFPDACRRTEKDQLRQYVRQNLQLTLSISAALLPLFLLGGFLVVLVYGREYAPSAAAFNILLAAYLVGFNAEPAAFILYPLNKPAWIAGKEFIPLVVFAGVGSLLIARYGILGAAWSVLLRRLIESLLTFALAGWYLRGGRVPHPG